MDFHLTLRRPWEAFHHRRSRSHCKKGSSTGASAIGVSPAWSPASRWTDAYAFGSSDMAETRKEVVKKPSIVLLC